MATSSSGETLTSANSRRPLSSATASIMPVTSQVRNTVTCGAVNAEATMFCAVSLRTPLIGMRSSPPDGAAARRGRASGAAWAREAASTSARETVPCGPVGVTRLKSTPRSLASLRTGGLARVGAAGAAGVTGASTGAGIGGGVTGSGGAGGRSAAVASPFSRLRLRRFGADSLAPYPTRFGVRLSSPRCSGSAPSTSNVASGAPTSTVSPAEAWCSASVPS